MFAFKSRSPYHHYIEPIYRKLITICDDRLFFILFVILWLFYIFFLCETIIYCISEFNFRIRASRCYCRTSQILYSYEILQNISFTCIVLLIHILYIKSYLMQVGIFLICVLVIDTYYTNKQKELEALTSYPSIILCKNLEIKKENNRTSENI